MLICLCKPYFAVLDTDDGVIEYSNSSFISEHIDLIENIELCPDYKQSYLRLIELSSFVCSQLDFAYIDKGKLFYADGYFYSLPYDLTSFDIEPRKLRFLDDFYHFRYGSISNGVMRVSGMGGNGIECDVVGKRCTLSQFIRREL